MVFETKGLYSFIDLPATGMVAWISRMHVLPISEINAADKTVIERK